MPRQHRSPWKLALTTAAAALCCLVPASASVATQPVGATSPPSLTSVDTASARVASLDLHRWRHGTTGRAEPTSSPSGSATAGSSVRTAPRSVFWE